MSGMNGIDVLRQMKMIALQLPVIFSTAYHEYKYDLNAWYSDEFDKSLYAEIERGRS